MRISTVLLPQRPLRFRLCLAAENSQDTTLVPKIDNLLNDSSSTVRLGAALAHLKPLLNSDFLPIREKTSDMILILKPLLENSKLTAFHQRI